jgi:threonine aldolase
MSTDRKIVDLRSDFLSRATPRMLRLMAKANAGSAGFGLREDSWQSRLEAEAAALLGKEDALLFPTCTMANQVAIILSTRPGDAVLTDAETHFATSEAGAPAAIGGVLIRGLGGDFGAPPIEEWKKAVSTPVDVQRSAVSLFILENTNNRGSGNALTSEYVDAVAAIASAAGSHLHIDGSRLFNAAVALGQAPARLAEPARSVSVSLNKGLGAPWGAILAGPRPFIAEALRVRQMLGGGVRPASMVAAAGIVALRNWRRLEDDHRSAEQLRQGCAGMPLIDRVVPPNATNIVILRLDPSCGGAEAFCRRLADEGVLALPFGQHQVRMVTYQDIDTAAVEFALSALHTIAMQIERGCQK